MKKRFFGFCLMMILCLTSIPCLAKQAYFEETDGQITVKLATDKQVYEVGEPISYALSIEDNREHWRITSVDITGNHAKGLMYIDGSESKYTDMIESGECVTLHGGLYMGEAPTTGFVTVDFSDIEVTDENTVLLENEAASNNTMLIIIPVAGLLLVAVIILIVVFKKKGNSKKTLSVFLAIAILGSSFFTGSLPVNAESKGNPEVSIRPYVNVTYGGEELTIRFIIKMKLGQEKQMIDAANRKANQRITCHDPSIFKDFDGTYYVFGTFLCTGSSPDLINWTSHDSEFQATFTDETKEKIRAWNKDEKAAYWNNYLWAPDVIYNPTMKKYCMYLSANGDDWKSNIVLLTADAAYGPYEYAGTIVYGGFDKDNFSMTDAPMVLGVDEIPERYVINGVKNRKWGDMFPNCIDPCTFYDEDGNLWMAYGSWSGGIFILELDEETGLRDYSVSYETNLHSDAYFGTKIAGGAYVSGEGSYIQKIGDYYFLFVSYGNLEANGGYNVRVFRSLRPDGDYVDVKGNDPFYDMYTFNYNSNKGVRLFGGYKWRHLTNGEVAQGHNSAMVDDDGRAYMVFHTRTTDGTEGHYVKVHQLFLNKEGWLVAAPFAMDGERRNESGYSVSEVAGKYEVIIHELDLNNKNLDTNKPNVVYLNEDGTITGTYEGTWSLEEGTDYITLQIGDNTYSGITLKMNVEKTNIETMVFTALGLENQLTIWGSKEF